MKYLEASNLALERGLVTFANCFIKPYNNMFYKFIYCAVFAFFILAQSSKAQDCNCDHVVPPSDNGQIIYASNYNGSPIVAGDTVCIMGGTHRKYLAFYDLAGTPEDPIVIINCNGQVNLIGEHPSHNGIDTWNSENFVITGTGDANVEYGFLVESSARGLRLNHQSKNYEVDHIHIRNVDIGLDLKNDPTCNPESWRSSGYVNDYVKVHDIYLENTRWEGFYIGDSHYNTTVTRTCNGEQIQIEETPIINAEIYNNIVVNTGNDGIQVGSVIGRAEIYNNQVIDFATSNTWAHRSGIQINPGTKAVIYGNLILDGPGSAIFSKGDGIEIYNNVAKNVKSGFEHYNSLLTPGSILRVYNNTFVDVFESGMPVISDTWEDNLFNNNIVHILPGAVYYGYNPLAAWTPENSENNYLTDDLNELAFVDYLNNDFSLTAQSTNLIDQGYCAPYAEMTTDFAENTRSFGNACDIGAYEYQSLLNPAPIGETIHLIANTNGKIIKWNHLNQHILEASITEPEDYAIFTVVDAGNGFIALKGHAGTYYVTSDLIIDPSAPLTASRGHIDAWEKFQWIDAGDGYFALKSNATQKYVSADLNRGSHAPLHADRNQISDWEKFTWIPVDFSSARFEDTSGLNGEITTESNFVVYPNPLVNSRSTKISLGKELHANGTLYVINASGQTVMTQQITSEIINLDLPNSINPGLYVLQLKTDGHTYNKKLIIK